MAVSHGTSPRIPWESPILRVVLASTLIMPLGVPLLSPVLPVLAGEFDISPARTSLLVSGYFLPGIVLSPVIGMVADRFGRRRVLVAALLVFGVTGGAMALLDRFLAIVVLRLVQGTAAASVFIVTVTLIADTFDGVQRNAVLGVNVSVLFLGAAIYPVVVGTSRSTSTSSGSQSGCSRSFCSIRPATSRGKVGSSTFATPSTRSRPERR